MQIFWLAAIVMLGAALFVVLGPLFRRSGTRNVDANTVQVDIYRTRLQEMETEMANGLLSAADAEAARTELARTLLQVTDTNGDKTVLQTGENTMHHWWAAGVIAVLVPIIAVSLYHRLGSPHMITGNAPVLGDIGGEAGHKASIDAMVKHLAERLEQNPNDPEGWMMLTNSYITLGKHKEALSAIERLYQISGDEPAVLVRYADILATVKGGDLSGRPTELIQKALSLDPDNTIGLWLAGIASARAGDPGTAIEYWHRLLPLLATDPASQKEVSDLIAQASGQMGGIPDTRAPSSTSASTPGTVAGVTNSALNIKVSLSAEISQDLSPDQSLFIVAKAVNGPPMPVAVIRKTAAELPLEITMDDKNAMMPSRKLSSFAQVEVSARISPSGNAIPQAGDLVSSTLTVSPGQADPVVLVIDRKVAVSAEANSALTIKVSLSPEISQGLSPDQTLFIVAKAVNGPPMPVAVIRKTAAELPLEITMDDKNAMMPSRKLSSFAQVEVSARISPSGNAIPQAGDLVSSTLTVSPGQADPVVLVIDRKVP